MVFKRLLNSLIFIGFSFLIIGCSATNEQLNEDLVNQKKIYEKEQITPILINEINQIILSIKQNNLALLNSKYIHPLNGYYEVIKFENRNIDRNKIPDFIIEFILINFNLFNDKAFAKSSSELSV